MKSIFRRLSARGSITAALVSALALTAAMTTGAGAPAMASAHSSDGGPAVAAVSLTADGNAHPLGIDDHTPELRWSLQSDERAVTQHAYQILVASSPFRLLPGRADMWATGPVTSADMQVRYAGKPLAPRTRYYWTVRVWTNAGARPAPGARVSDWSRPAWFETAYLASSQWQGSWITGDPARQTAVQTAAQGTADDVCCAQVNTTLGEPAAAGDTNIKVGTTNGLNVGDMIMIGATGSQETATVAKVGTGAASNTTLAAAASAGDTNVGVNDVTGYAVGAPLVVDTGAAQQAVTITSVGTAASAPTTLAAPAAAGDTNVQVASVAGFTAGQQFVVDTGTNAEKPTLTNVGTVTRTTSLFGPAAAGGTTIEVTSTASLNAGDTLIVDPGPNQEKVKVSAVGTAGINSALAATTVTTTPPAVPSYASASWIWNTANSASSAASGTIYLRKTFTVTDPSAITNAWLRINVDDSHVTYVNGTQVTSSSVANGWQTSQYVNIKPELVAGTNVVAVAATNGSAAAGMIAAVQLDGNEVVSDATWKALPGVPAVPPSGWNTAGFDDSSWSSASVAGTYPLAPWNTLADPAVPAPNNIKVASVTGFAAGDTLTVDPGPNQETATIQSVGTAGASGTGLTLTANLATVHPVSAVVLDTSDAGTGLTITPALTGAHAVLASVIAPGTGITFTPALSVAHAQGTTIRGLGGGISFTPAITASHASGAAVSSPGTGLTLTAALTTAQAAGTQVLGPQPKDICRPSAGFSNAGTCAPIRPTEYLRKDFTVAPVSDHGPVVSARLYSTGLGWDNMTMNGSKTEPNAYLNPGFTSYDQTVQYTTDDITKLVRQDYRKPVANVVAAELAAGRYDAASSPSNHAWERAQWRAPETLRADLYITYADGTQQLIKTDSTWQESTAGPTRLADYDLGETYDARQVMPGWNTAPYNTSSWPAATQTQGPAGKVVAQKEPLTEVTAVHPNTNDTTFTEWSPSTGTYAWDVGQQYTGFATIKVWGATPGQVIRVVFVERRNATSISQGVVTGPQQGALVPPGNLSQMYYVSDGSGTTEANAEVYSPHTWFGGFQWVLVSGSNGAALPSNVHVMVTSVSELHTAMPQTGTFTSDNTLLNSIYTALNGSAIGDYVGGQSMDTPTYEKDGWTGDTQLMAPTVSYMYNTETQYQKSSQDVVDSQAIGDEISASNTGGSPPMPGGQVGLLIPSDNGYGYCSPTGTAYQCGNSPSAAVFKGTSAGDTPIWDAWLQIAPWTLYQYYDDISGLQTAYPAMKKYLTQWIPYWFQAYNTSIDNTKHYLVNSRLGDWDPPNGSATDSVPGQNTNVAQPTIISQSSSAYVAYEAQITANAARALAAADPANAAAYNADAAQFDQMYASIKADYNAKFWNATDGYYEGDTTGSTFSQAAQILPLAFGLVPDGQQVPLETKLVNDVVNTRTNHEEVGIAGARWFFPVLTQAAADGVPGAAQAAYAVALQTTYPSYGWEQALGWTGIGENWDSTTRTRDHQMFGTIGQWMYQYLAGLDSTSPGFQTVDIRPLITPNAGINNVAATYNSDRGMFKSSWTISSSGIITMDITIPANTTAKVYVPGTTPNSVTERGTGRTYLASKAPGVSLQGVDGNSVVYNIGSGSYEFVVSPH